MMNLGPETQGELRQSFLMLCAHHVPPNSTAFVLLTVSRGLERNGGRLLENQ